MRCPKCSELVKCNDVVGNNRFEDIAIKKASGGQRVAEDKTNREALPSLKEFITKYHKNKDLYQLDGVQAVELSRLSSITNF